MKKSLDHTELPAPDTRNWFTFLRGKDWRKKAVSEVWKGSLHVTTGEGTWEIQETERDKKAI